METSVTSVMRCYGGLVDVMVADLEDSHLRATDGVAMEFTRTLMTTIEDKVQLARDVLSIAARVARVSR